MYVAPQHQSWGFLLSLLSTSLSFPLQDKQGLNAKEILTLLKVFQANK